MEQGPRKGIPSSHFRNESTGSSDEQDLPDKADTTIAVARSNRRPLRPAEANAGANMAIASIIVAAHILIPTILGGKGVRVSSGSTLLMMAGIIVINIDRTANATTAARAILPNFAEIGSTRNSSALHILSVHSFLTWSQ